MLHQINALGGYTLEVADGDYLGERLAGGKPYERRVLRIAARLARGGLFVDVGAHIGNHSVYVAKTGAKVVAIEPHPDTFEILERNVASNGLTVDLVNAACGASSAQASIELNDPANTGSAVITVGGGTIRVVTLDSLGLAPSVVKIDVEGHELEVLKGAEQTLIAHRPAVIVEHHSGPIDEVFAQFGYRRVAGTVAGSPTFLYVADRRQHTAVLHHTAAAGVRNFVRRIVKGR